METIQTPKVEFRKVRDFGQLFNDVFRFHKYNFKTIFVCVLLIPGPIFLIAGGFYGYLQSMGSDPSRLLGLGMIKNPMAILSNMLTFMLPYFVLAVLGTLASSATIKRYFIIYQERGENNSITVGDIVKHLPADMWRLFYNGLLLGVVSIIFLLVLFVIALIPILGMLAIVIGMLILGPPLSYAIISGNYLVLRDEVSIIQGIQKSWGYMRGNFWWTWLIVVVAALLVGIVGAIFGAPMSILTAVNTFSRLSTDSGSETSSIVYIILGTIAIFGPQLPVSITTLFSVLAFHSYEELEEGTMLKDKISQIGSD